ncbi:hypothetical protein [Silvimonas amylolytica]|uniref:Uncharacterized protein n=1 Tax=Silvimonas amylolytica TaxID=449663 RepID=A0ABQ2PTB8_9NEIS|nr:hypothetical protein [Silvimonas amylolytica]GGP24432.1 hypothetical protein GCM10010971_02510 [Silvimonas amylolytica]GGP28341.1 hypothetical protein GCM10010971_41600 [Silvimonas amylolytica]
MRFKTTATVVGAKMFKGEVDGQNYDSTTVFTLMDQDESKGTARGFAIADFKFPSSDLFQQLKALKYPIQAELELDQVSNGKTVKTVLVGLKPLGGVNTADGTLSKAG